VIFPPRVQPARFLLHRNKNTAVQQGRLPRLDDGRFWMIVRQASNAGTTRNPLPARLGILEMDDRSGNAANFLSAPAPK
jgi:hypothetical protein